MNAILTEASRYHDAQAYGYFAVRAYGSQSLYPLADMAQVLSCEPVPPDLQISQAEYRSRRNRRISNVLRIDLNFVDCDLHRSRYAALRPEQVARLLILFCEDEGIPVPNLINFSGRGLHVKWLLDAPIPASALSRWGFVQKALASRLDDFGADRGALDASRCLRAVGTLNIKSGEIARTVWDDGRCWDFDMLANAVLPHTREQVAAYRAQMAQKKAAREKRRAEATAQDEHARSLNLWTIADLWCRRLEDVRTVVELRGWHNGVPEGNRGYVLFVATICCQWAHRPSDLEAEARELARQLCPSYSPADVRSCVCSVVSAARQGKPYRLRTQTILDLLNITPREQRQLQTLYNPDERKRRRQEYDRARKWGEVNRETFLAGAAQRRTQAQALSAQGLKQAQIAAQMNCSVNAVKSLLKRGRPTLTH